LRASDPNRFSQVGIGEGLLGSEEADLPPEDMESGRFEYATGVVYEGQFLNRLKHGEGEQTWPDGARYVG
jgi:hypothetical protein